MSEATERRLLRTKITKLHTKIMKEDLADYTKQQIEFELQAIREIKLKIENLNKIVLGAVVANNTVDGVLDEKKVETEIVANDAYNDQLLEMKVQLEQFSQPIAKQTGNNEVRVHLDKALKLPQVTCPTFSGDSKNPFEYTEFRDRFKAIVDSQQVDHYTKMICLKQYLKGHAYRLLLNLEYNQEAYAEAWKILDEEFYDQQKIIDMSIKKLLDMTCEAKIDKWRSFINDVKVMLCDLKNLKVNFLEEGSGNLLLSHIIFTKLPTPLRRELINICGNYPTVNELFEHYNDILYKLERTWRHKETPKDDSKNHHPKDKGPNSFHNQKKSPPKEKEGTLQNFHLSNPGTASGPSQSGAQAPKYPCKLCTGLHWIKDCVRYPSYQSRVTRCNELKLCVRCAKSHDQNTCPLLTAEKGRTCFICKTSKEHIQALCPNRTDQDSQSCNLCMTNTGDSQDQVIILPTITLTLKVGNVSKPVRFLWDSGSQRTYVDSQVLSDLNLQTTTWNKGKQTVNTFLGLGQIEYHEVSVGIDLPDFEVQVPILFSDKVHVEFNIPNLTHIIYNLKCKGYTLADSAFESVTSDVISLQ